MLELQLLGSSGCEMLLEHDSNFVNESTDICSCILDILANSVYVGNLPYTTTIAEIKEFFNYKDGIIKRIVMPDNTHQDPNLKSAYIEFCCTEAVDDALQLDGAFFNGRELQVKYPDNMEDYVMCKCERE